MPFFKEIRKYKFFEFRKVSSFSTYRLSNFRSSPSDKSTSNRYRSSCFLYLNRCLSSLYGDEQGACAFLKIISKNILGMLCLCVLAALPLVFLQEGEQVVFRFWELINIVKGFFTGLVTGDSFYYMQGDRKRWIINDMGDALLLSFFYLIIAGVILIIFSFGLGIWFWRVSEKYLHKTFGFLTVLPDFVFILFLQLAVTFVYKQFHWKIAKVATFHSNDPAVLLPLLSLIVIPLFYIIRTLNERTKDVLTQEYILTAVAKGISRRSIYLFHVTTNVTPFLKADLHKIISIMISSLFITEYMFNINGITAMLFQTQTAFGYQYPLVIFSFLGLFLLYAAVFFLLYGMIRIVEGVLRHD